MEPSSKAIVIWAFRWQTPTPMAHFWANEDAVLDLASDGQSERAALAKRQLKTAICSRCCRRLLQRLRMDSWLFGVFANELANSACFRRRFLHSWTAELVTVRLVDPPTFPLDYHWCHKVEALLRRHLELEKLMWYMSTLGGAFSALGDVATEFAEKAGQLSWKQLRVALELGDPITVARCKLYIALSFIQTGRLNAAKKIIRAQYQFAISASSDCRVLINACLGVWSKLKYTYDTRKKQLTK